MSEGKHQRSDTIQHQHKHHRQKNQHTEPVLLSDIPADICHRQCRNCPQHPESVIPKQIPPHRAERHLEQIDQRLADQKEYKCLESGIKRCPAVDHNDDRKEDPCLKCDSHVIERSLFKSRNDQKHSGHNRCQHCIYDNYRSAHVQPAIDCVSKTFQNAVLFHPDTSIREWTHFTAYNYCALCLL